MNIFKLLSLLYLKNVYAQMNSCDTCISDKLVGQNIDCTEICFQQTTHLTDCLEYTSCLYDYDLYKENNVCVCHKTICEYEYVCPNIEVLNFNDNNNVDGYTVYEISLEIKDINSNIYAIYGDSVNNMIVPPAYQLQNHRGANIGGINPLLIQYIPETAYDSWLTIQLTDGNVIGQVDAIGIDFPSWGPNNGLVIDDGAIFLDDPLQQISATKKYIIGHLNLKDSDDHQMIINVNGKLNINNHRSQNFRELNIIFNFPKLQDNGH